MPDSAKHQIMQKITSLSTGDNHLGELLSYCIGRLCLKSAKDGADWHSKLNSIDVPHIVDWLKAAIINEDAWLKNVDDQNRPKKLMKFSSFEDIQKEADKAVKIANQKNSGIKLVEGDEEMHMQLEDGYYLVKLLTPAALDREGAQMQHCIGNGVYDEFLDSDEHYFLSLRDGYGKPHATLEVSGNGVYQLQGKQNRTPQFKYIKTLKPYFAQTKLSINISIRNLGYVVSSDGDAYRVDDLPDGLEVIGSLYLRDTPIKSLPNGLKVGGDLNLELTTTKSLPKGLIVGGYLDLSSTQIKSLPEGLKVGGYLDLRATPIQHLPKGIEIGGSLLLEGTSIQSLPEDLKVGGSLHLGRTPIKSLPKGIEVAGSLLLNGAPIQSLPEDLKVGGSLCLGGTPIKSLPKGIEVAGSLDITGTKITSLPEGLKVRGDLDLRRVPIELLPAGIEVGGSLDITGTKITSLPEDLKVDKNIYDFQKQIKLASSSHKNTLRPSIL